MQKSTSILLKTDIVVHSQHRLLKKSMLSCKKQQFLEEKKTNVKLCILKHFLHWF